MELSVREAAQLTGRSPRTLRAQLARGEVPGVKRHGRWVLERRHLPLTEAQRRRLSQRADDIRRKVEDVLPSRAAGRRGDRARSLADLDAFRLTLDLHNGLKADDHLPPELRDRLTALTGDALVALAEAFHEYHRDAKRLSVQRARSALAHLAAVLLIEHGRPPPEPAVAWFRRAEQEVLPAEAGLARFIDRLRKRR